MIILTPPILVVVAITIIIIIIIRTAVVVIIVIIRIKFQCQFDRRNLLLRNFIICLSLIILPIICINIHNGVVDGLEVVVMVV